MRKAVQRLEDAKPAKVARLRKTFTSGATIATLPVAYASKREEPRTAKAKKNSFDKRPAVMKKECGTKSEPTIVSIEAGQISPQTFDNANWATSLLSLLSPPLFSDPPLTAGTSHQGLGARDATTLFPSTLIQDQRNSFSEGSLGLASDFTELLSEAFSGGPRVSLMSSYEPFLALRLQEQRRRDELASIHALHLRHEIEHYAQRFYALRNTHPWRVAAAVNPLLLGQISYQPQTHLASPPAATLSNPATPTFLHVPYILKKYTKD
jgi:hypothetical protein